MRDRGSGSAHPSNTCICGSAAAGSDRINWDVQRLTQRAQNGFGRVFDRVIEAAVAYDYDGCGVLVRRGLQGTKRRSEVAVRCLGRRVLTPPWRGRPVAEAQHKQPRACCALSQQRDGFVARIVSRAPVVADQGH